MTSTATLGELFVEAARAYPTHDAVIAEGLRWSYADLSERASAMVQALKDRGIAAGHGVAVLSSNCPEVIAFTVAAQLMGLRVTPLHPLGSESDHEFVIEDAEIDLLVVDNAVFASRGRSLGGRFPMLQVLTLGPSDFGCDLTALARIAPAGDLKAEAPADGICLVTYTGGTTGRPKGVVHTQASFMAAVILMLATWEWPATPRFLAVTPVSHAAGAILWPVFARGGAVLLQTGFEPGTFLRAIGAMDANVAFLVPTMIYRLLDAPELDRCDISNLQMAIYGAAPMSPERLADAVRRFGPVLCQLYAQTEAPNVVCYLSKRDHLSADPALLGSCGRPAPGVAVSLRDPAGVEVEPGKPGEIWVRGPHIMAGYWKRPEETAAAFQDGWLRTGDIAIRQKTGTLRIVDRLKDMIVSGGFNIYPSEVEAVLLSDPAVADAVVIGIPDARWGEAVAAFVMARAGAKLEVDRLIDLVRVRRGAAWAPKFIEQASSLPLTPLGKVDRKALRARFWSGRDRQVS